MLNFISRARALPRSGVDRSAPKLTPVSPRGLVVRIRGLFEGSDLRTVRDPWGPLALNGWSTGSLFFGEGERLVVQVQERVRAHIRQH